jgi:hypothetical protein
MLNIQAGISNIPSFNATQGPSVAEIQRVEVQKDSSTPQGPDARKRPGKSTGEKNKSSNEDEEEKRTA